MQHSLDVVGSLVSLRCGCVVGGGRVEVVAGMGNVGGAWEGEPERGKGRGREAECDKGINRQTNCLHRATSAFGFAVALTLASVVGVGIGVVVGVVPGVVAGVMAVIGVVGGTGDDLALALVLGFFTGDGLSSELMRLEILFFGGIGYGGT